MSHEVFVMWTVAQIAGRDNVTRQAVSKAIRKLIDEMPDTPVDRDNRGRVDRVSLAHYDEFRLRYVNPAKASAPIRPALTPEKLSQQIGDTFEEARRQSEWIKVGRERIRHQEEIGQLVRRDKVNDALRHVGGEMQAVIARLPNYADDLSKAVYHEGVHGIRAKLRQMAFEIGAAVADRLAAIAAEAPESDPLIGDQRDDQDGEDDGE